MALSPMRHVANTVHKRSEFVSLLVAQVASELLFQFGLQALDLSFCSQLSDAPFEAGCLCIASEYAQQARYVLSTAYSLY